MELHLFHQQHRIDGGNGGGRTNWTTDGQWSGGHRAHLLLDAVQTICIPSIRVQRGLLRSRCPRRRVSRRCLRCSDSRKRFLHFLAVVVHDVTEALPAALWHRDRCTVVIFHLLIWARGQSFVVAVFLVAIMTMLMERRRSRWLWWRWCEVGDNVGGCGAQWVWQNGKVMSDWLVRTDLWSIDDWTYLAYTHVDAADVLADVKVEVLVGHPHVSSLGEIVLWTVA